MKRPAFPGNNDSIPDINDALPSFTFREGVLNVDPGKARKVFADDFGRTLLDQTRAEVDVAIAAARASNTGRSVLNRLERLSSLLGTDEFDEIKLGLALLSLENHSALIVKEQATSLDLEASLRFLLQISPALRNELPRWSEYWMHQTSFDIKKDEITESRALFHEVLHTLEESADLVSKSVITELKAYDSFSTQDPEVEKDYTITRIKLTNNLLISLIKEVRSSKAGSDTWIAKMLASRLLKLLSRSTATRVWSEILGWIKHSAAKIREIIR